MPCARLLQQHATILRLEPRAQKIGKELVVAIPLAAVVERQQEHVRLLEARQKQLAVAAAGHRITKGRAEPVEHAGLGEKRADVVRLAAQDFAGEIVDHVAVLAAEGGCALVHIFRTVDANRLLPRQRRHLQAGNPTLGAIAQRTHRIPVQLEAHCSPQEQRRLVKREAKIVQADFVDAAKRTPAREGEIGLIARHQDEAQLFGHPLDQEFNRRVDFRIADQVVIVERQHDPALRFADLVQQ